MSEKPCLCPNPPTPELLAGIRDHLTKSGTSASDANRKAQHIAARVADWSHGSDKLRSDWVAVARNAIREGWALKGWVDTPTPVKMFVEEPPEPPLPGSPVITSDETL